MLWCTLVYFQENELEYNTLGLKLILLATPNPISQFFFFLEQKKNISSKRLSPSDSA
jgi:hypothetical protein